MEYPQDTITHEQYEELEKVAKANVCSECGADLQVHTNPEKKTVEVGCLTRSHHGFTERETYTQMMRRGATLPDVIADQIKGRMLPRGATAEDFQRTMNLLGAKYPDLVKDGPSAALFLMDCYRLGLDPLISPPEIVPVVFGKHTDKPVVVEIITEDGYLSGAARANPEEWDGPPKTMPLEDYLLTLPHLKDRPLSDIEKIAKRQAKDLCGDEEAWIWVALGKRKTGTQTDSPSFGWFTHEDLEDAQKRKVISAKLPGNQARIRAVKRWTRETFPEWRQKMMDLTSEWIQRSAGVSEAQKLIEGEYRIVETRKKVEPQKKIVEGKATTKPVTTEKKSDPLASELFGSGQPEVTPGPGGELPMTDEDKTKSRDNLRDIVLGTAKRMKDMLDDKKQQIWPTSRILQEISKVAGVDVHKITDIPDDKLTDVANHLYNLENR